MKDNTKDAEKVETSTPAQPEQKRNRFDRMFGKPIFKAASPNATCYPRKDGSASQLIAHVSVPMLLDGKPSGAAVSGVINGQKRKGQKGVTPSFKFISTMQKGEAIQTEDPAAAVELTAFGKRIANVDYPKWYTDHAAAVKAAQAVLGDENADAVSLDIVLNDSDDAA